MIFLYVSIFLLILILFITYLFKYQRLCSEQKALKIKHKQLTHKLRTSLCTIQTGAQGIKRYLPKLLSVYCEYADTADFSGIPPQHLQLLMDALDNIEVALKDATNRLEKY